MNFPAVIMSVLLFGPVGDSDLLEPPLGYRVSVIVFDVSIWEPNGTDYMWKYTMDVGCVLLEPHELCQFMTKVFLDLDR